MLIVIAEKEELKLVENLGYGGYPVLITGVGAINVINALKDLPRDTEILNIGYCGSKSYKVGEKLEIIAVGTNHENAEFPESKMALHLHSSFYNCTGKAYCYTSTDFVIDTKRKDNCVFDMELAFIRAMFGNVSAIKVVSDNLSIKEFRENE